MLDNSLLTKFLITVFFTTRLVRNFLPEVTPSIDFSLYKKALVLLLAAYLAACTTTQSTVSTPVTVEPKPKPEFSPSPINFATKQQIVFAQTALDKLGYNIGIVDGIWGPRSVKAIKKFESKEKLTSANGFLSALNLDRLAKVSQIDPNSLSFKPRNLPKGLRAKLSNKPLTEGPQLVIVDKDYDVFTKPNPYSETAHFLPAGTGIYVLAEEAGWFKVELINRKQGYIQAD